MIMTNKVYYIENSNTTNNVLAEIERTFPCFINREYIEMNYSQVTIKARYEDLAGIERMLAPLV